jgi:hypothetical protein
MLHVRAWALPLSILLAPAAWAADAEWLMCRQKTDAAQRLACYDAVGVAPSATSSPPPQTAPMAAMPAAPAPASALRQTPEQFGQDPRVGALEAIETRFTGTFEGWSPREKIRLANGQVWQVMDESSAAVYLQNPKIRLRRGALGAFFLEVEGLNRSARVKRLE